ncbi:hypothetical protein BpHYR1_038726 [Brachionus plicatilis]|uniref:Uncharacterized protein n=1 Tax=Brachionus plicatilis TaxID=10195 RepID=A0A3M7SAJ8_BRAPC|nr:hypothetical protein BpHYR1_038726 [Brachionus plicatilis]
MSGSTNQDLDKAFLSIISDFENTLRLDDTTMDEAAVDRKILDHAEVQKKFLEQKTKEIVDQMEKSLDQKLNDFLNNLRGQENAPGQQHQNGMAPQGDIQFQAQTVNQNQNQNDLMYPIAALINELRLNRTMFQGLPKMNFGNQPTFSAKDTENLKNG